MSITYPLSMPATPGFRNFILGENNIVSIAVSPFTGSTQVQQWPGEWWEADCALPPLPQSTVEPWKVFLTSLRGQVGSFLLGDVLNTRPAGVATGTPVVNGAQVGGSNTLATRGWTHNVTGILQAGDYIQIGTGLKQRLYKILTTQNSDSSGDATFDIFPAIRPEGVTDGQSIVTVSPQGVFRLSGNYRSWSSDVTRLTVISFKCVEAL